LFEVELRLGNHHQVVDEIVGLVAARLKAVPDACSPRGRY
jgi:hypothetical protein